MLRAQVNVNREAILGIDLLYHNWEGGDAQYWGGGGPTPL